MPRKQDCQERRRQQHHGRDGVEAVNERGVEVVRIATDAEEVGQREADVSRLNDEETDQEPVEDGGKLFAT